MAIDVADEAATAAETADEADAPAAAASETATAETATDAADAPAAAALPDVEALYLDEAEALLRVAGCAIGTVSVTAPPRERGAPLEGRRYRVVRCAWRAAGAGDRVGEGFAVASAADAAGAAEASGSRDFASDAVAAGLAADLVIAAAADAGGIFGTEARAT
jgi:hypothetical protein